MKRLQRSERVSSLADGVFGRLERSEEGRAQARVVTAWRHVAGAEVFAHARGFALREGELLVFVDESTWANELAVLSEHYRGAVNERLGKEVVSSIRFAVSKRVSRDRSFEEEDSATAEALSREQAPPVPLTRTEREQLSLMAAAVKNERLRETVIAAATAHLQWRKGIEARNAAEKATQRATEGLEPPRG
jgi:hypothetical protein